MRSEATTISSRSTEYRKVAVWRRSRWSGECRFAVQRSGVMAHPDKTYQAQRHPACDGLIGEDYHYCQTIARHYSVVAVRIIVVIAVVLVVAILLFLVHVLLHLQILSCSLLCGTTSPAYESLHPTCLGRCCSKAVKLKPYDAETAILQALL